MNPILWTKKADPTFLRLDLDPKAEEAIEELFDKAAEVFLESVEQLIPFDAGYTVKEGECFEIDNFKMDEGLLAACDQPLTAERVQAKNVGALELKAVVGYKRDGKSQTLLLQNFDGRRVLVPGRRFAITAMADSSTFQALKRPVVVLDARISAIWMDGKLLFKSFHLAKQMVDLTEHFQAASDKQLESFAKHKLIECGDVAKFVDANNFWTRKKVAMILASGYLDKVPAKEMKGIASNVQYDLVMKNGKIIMPEEPKLMQELLHFLDEELYVGYFSKKPFLTNSKRGR